MLILCTFIREALINDLDGITDCAERFFAYAKYTENGLPLDRDSFKSMVRGVIESENGIVLLLMDKLYVAGGIAGSVLPWGFNKSIKFCHELFYWVDEKYRGRKSLELLIKYEKKAMSLGANKSIMISVNTDLKDKVNLLYKRMGYVENEQQFIKAL